MSKCLCKDFNTGKRCPIHPKISPAYKMLRQQFLERGVEWLADEVMRLRKELRKHEKPKSIGKGMIPTEVIDDALSYQSSKREFRSISHSDAFAVSLIMGVPSKLREKAYKRLKNKIGNTGQRIAKQQGWI